MNQLRKLVNTIADLVFITKILQTYKKAKWRKSDSKGKTKIITAIVPIIIPGITIWWYFEYQNRAASRAFRTQMLKEDCFEVDAQLTKDNELLNDPKVFDCSKDILENFKPNFPGPIPDIRRASWSGRNKICITSPPWSILCSIITEN